MGVNILLMVKDASTSLRFYQKIGFEEIMLIRGHGHLYYGEMIYRGKNDGTTLMFLEKENWHIKKNRDQPPNPGTILIYVPVENLDEVFEKVRQVATVISPPTELYYGKEFIISDEDGYKLAFFQEYPEGERVSGGVEIWKKNKEK
jgi:catechol 2,3-dioxygenase-like lactoylglutathione lyase family enzyme